MSEEDTFRLLKRIPFSRMWLIIEDELAFRYMPARAFFTSRKQLLKEHGWTEKEYDAALIKRVDNEKQ